ncbi:MAG: preprotein translocase subunit SecE [Bacteroidales bacterium]|nr:preprotein translocase subunit SecE [Bacteroidales bacterium]
MRKFINYLNESTVELTKKTTWPSWEKLMNSALLVMVTTALLAVAIWVIDYAFQLVMTAIYSL